MPCDEHNVQPLGADLRLTPAAGALLELLEDLGYLDGLSIGLLADTIAETPGHYGVSIPPGIIDRAALRRAAAVVLSEPSLMKRDPEQAGLLEKEWPLLFG